MCGVSTVLSTLLLLYPLAAASNAASGGDSAP